MKILKLTANNFKKLSAVEISPDGNVVLITGKNEAGKSSVIDAAEAALCGGAKLPKQPIKTGEHRAMVETIIGDENDVPKYKVTRKFLGTNSTLTVETVGENRARISSPQSFLDSVVGSISFDPLAFMKQTPAEQRCKIMTFLGLNLDEFDARIASLKLQRSDLRKEKEKKLHEAESLTYTSGLPTVEQGADELLLELQAIREHNEKSQRIEVANASHRSQLVRYDEDIKAAQKALLDWQKRLNTLTSQRTDLETLLQKQPEIPTKNPAEVEQKIKSLSETNEAIRVNRQKALAIKTSEVAVEDYTKLGDEMKITETNKARKMAEAVMPVKGLTILPDGLAYGGIPLDGKGVNDAKKLEICVAIAMAMNPKLKVLRISGNDLDKNSLSIIGKLVADKDYQVWIEKVMDENTIGFYIEDGSLVERPENTSI